MWHGHFGFRRNDHYFVSQYNNFDNDHNDFNFDDNHYDACTYSNLG